MEIISFEDRNFLFGRPIRSAIRFIEQATWPVLSFLTIARDWATPFPTLVGEPGQEVTVTSLPQCTFKPTRLVIYEFDHDGKDKVCRCYDGTRTNVTSLLIGRKNQLPTTNDGISSSSFNQNNVGRTNITFDTCGPGDSMSITLKFREKCRVMATFFGYAVI